MPRRGAATTTDVDQTPQERRQAKVREQRRVRAEAGLCIHCGVLAESGKTQCARHLDLARRGMRDLQQTRRQLGMCVHCDELAQPGFATCPEHGTRSAEAQRDARARKKEHGECSRCKRKVVPGHALCRRHIAADRAEQEREKNARADRRSMNVAEGLCYCGKERAPKSKHCAKHRAALNALTEKQDRARARKKVELRPGVIRRQPKKDNAK